MPEFCRLYPLSIFLLMCTGLFASAAQASVVSIDVPMLASAGYVKGFQFTSFDFNVTLGGGTAANCDPSTDYCANVIANDHENYTYLAPAGCATRYCTPSYIRINGSTYSDAYVTVSTPPTGVDALFHFSSADIAGQALNFVVSDAGNYTLKLFDDATSLVVPLDSVLGGGTYTLEYTTDNIVLNGLDKVTATLDHCYTG